MEAENTYTVALKPKVRVDLKTEATGMTSMVLITGLTNTLMSLSLRLLTYTAAPTTFLPDSDFGDSLVFNPYTGKVCALLPHWACTTPPLKGQKKLCMKTGSSYGFMLLLKNPMSPYC